MLEDLISLNETADLEREIAQKVVETVASGVPELTDHSPSAPHVVLAEGMAQGSAVLAYYALQMPRVVEEWILTELMAASPFPALQSRVSMTLAFSTPSASRTIPAGFRVGTGGVTFTLMESFTYPDGVYGNEQVGGVYLYPLIFACDTPGAVGNVAAGTITQVIGSMPALVSVNNPNKAFGGADAESYSDMRLRYLRRGYREEIYTTPLDFEVAVQKYLGGGLVYVITDPVLKDSFDGEPGKIYLSIVSPDGTLIASHLALQNHLTARSPFGPVELIPPETVTVDINLTITFDPTLTTEDRIEQDVPEQVAGYLIRQFWENWGKDENVVYRSEIIGRIQQNIVGVVKTELSLPAADVDLLVPYAVPTLGTLTLTLVSL